MDFQDPSKTTKSIFTRNSRQTGLIFQGLLKTTDSKQAMRQNQGLMKQSYAEQINNKEQKGLTLLSQDHSFDRRANSQAHMSLKRETKLTKDQSVSQRAKQRGYLDEQ